MCDIQGMSSEFGTAVVLLAIQIIQTEIPFVRKHLSNSNENEISSEIRTDKSGFEVDADKI